MSSYLLVSLPSSIASSGDSDDAFKQVASLVSSEVSLVPFNIPQLKIGTLDALVVQADDLTKLDTATEGTVAKVSDILNTLFEGDDRRIKENMVVNEKPFEQYLRSFSWNKVKYRQDKPIADIVDSIRKEVTSLDNDVKSKYNAYTQSKTNLQSLQRKQQGNLSIRSLAPILKKEHFVPESEYLQTCLIAIPHQSIKEFLGCYETLAPMVVPRSASVISEDSEFSLYSVVVFKKHASEFSHKAREKKYVPRDATYSDTSSKDEQAETKSAEDQTEKLWGETLRLSRTAYSEVVAAWMHIKTLRIFVETVLRYGLPMDFMCGVFIENSSKSSGKAIKKAREALEAKYAFLGGNAYGKDKKGKIVRKDDSSVSEFTIPGAAGEDYTPFVEYEMKVH